MDEKIVELLNKVSKSLGLELKLKENEAKMYRDDRRIPVSLKVEEENGKVTVSLEVEEGVEDALLELKDAEEDVKSIVDEEVGVLRDAALEIMRELNKCGVKVDLKLREAEMDLDELLESALEE